MRKFIVAATVLALGALLAIPAWASFDHHFSVLAKTTSARQVGENRFRFKDKLLDPSNRRDRVGRDRGECRFNTQTRKAECHTLIHLNGEIGGFGDIKVRGDIGRGDHRLVALGGSDDFNGVAGKMLLHSRDPRPDKLHFDLVR
jgi:hypothetical protein